MIKPITYIFDAVTKQEVIREMTDEEHTQYILDAANMAQFLEERAANSATETPAV